MPVGALNHQLNGDGPATCLLRLPPRYDEALVTLFALRGGLLVLHHPCDVLATSSDPGCPQLRGPRVPEAAPTPEAWMANKQTITLEPNDSTSLASKPKH